jgi:hypothetical protein
MPSRSYLKKDWTRSALTNRAQCLCHTSVFIYILNINYLSIPYLIQL